MAEPNAENRSPRSNYYLTVGLLFLAIQTAIIILAYFFTIIQSLLGLFYDMIYLLFEVAALYPTTLLFWAVVVVVSRFGDGTAGWF